MGFVLGLDELLKGHYVQWAAQENEHSWRAVLNDSRVEHETFYAEWEVQVVVEISDAHELLLLKWLNEIPVNLLLEFSHVIFLVFEHFL